MRCGDKARRLAWGPTEFAATETRLPVDALWVQKPAARLPGAWAICEAAATTHATFRATGPRAPGPRAPEEGSWPTHPVGLEGEHEERMRDEVAASLPKGGVVDREAARISTAGHARARRGTACKVGGAGDTDLDRLRARHVRTGTPKAYRGEPTGWRCATG